MIRTRNLVPSVLLASMLAFLAAPAAASSHKCAPSESHGYFMEHRGDHMAKHHQQLHAALKLTPEQEGAWKKLMDSETPMAKMAPGSPEEMAKLTTPERAEKMLAHMKEHQALQAAHVAAITEFYAVLTPEQKKTFDEFHSTGMTGMHGKTKRQAAVADKAPKSAPEAKSPTKHESAGAYLDDSVITAKVKAAVLNEPTLKSAEINVETYKGVVQLTGFVSSRASADKATEVARGVKGAISVKNDMIIKGQQ